MIKLAKYTFIHNFQPLMMGLTGNKRYVCTLCDKVFTIKTDLITTNCILRQYNVDTLF